MTDFDPAVFGSPSVRVGTAEREQAAAALGDHFAAGRLELDEYDERVSRVYAAKTAADLIVREADPADRRSQHVKLTPKGVRLAEDVVLATNADRHMAELWARLPSARYRLTFPAERAAALLATIGATARVTDVEGTVVFQDDAQARQFLRNQVRPASAVDRMEAFEGSLTATRRAAVIVAEVPR